MKHKAFFGREKIFLFSIGNKEILVYSYFFTSLQLVTSIVSSKLREFLSLSRDTRAGLTVRGGEVVMDVFVPPLDLAKGCKVRARSKGFRAVARVHRSSKLRAAAGITGDPGEDDNTPSYKPGGGSKEKTKEEEEKGGGGGFDLKEGVENLLKGLRKVRTSLFVGGELDVSLKAEGEVKARLGKDIFGRCLTKYRNSFPLKVASSGKVWIGAQVI